MFKLCSSITKKITSEKDETIKKGESTHETENSVKTAQPTETTLWLTKDETVNREAPTAKMEEIAENARTTGTTLWFTEEDNEKNRLNDIIATAQFTLCNSLLKYFKELEKEENLYKNLANLSELTTLKDSLISDWQHFKNNPYFLLTTP